MAKSRCAAHLVQFFARYKTRGFSKLFLGRFKRYRAESAWLQQNELLNIPRLAHMGNGCRVVELVETSCMPSNFRILGDHSVRIRVKLLVCLFDIKVYSYYAG
jgi:hypothetical protein